MTANPVKPARYRPGKVVAEDSSSEDDDSDEEQRSPAQKPALEAPPKVTSFSSKDAQLAARLQRTKFDQDHEKAKAKATQLEAEKLAQAAADEGFVTEGSSEEDSPPADSNSEEDSSSAESSSEEEGSRRPVRPVFIKKAVRKEVLSSTTLPLGEDSNIDEDARRKQQADIMIQERLEKDAMARAAGRKNWDDDEIEEVDQVDDTDGLDPETERAAWKLRELKRVKRERETVEMAEKERDEVERRRNLSKEDREEEDREFLESQKEAGEGKGKMSYMQKYFHKGAFYQDDEVAKALAERDIMGSRIADDVSNRDLLPQYMQIRDMTKLGRKGRTKYKDLKTEDTGRWGDDLNRGPRSKQMDERFMSDRDRERTGANTTVLGERGKAPRNAPTSPKRENNSAGNYRPQRDRSPGDHASRRSRERNRSGSHSPQRRERRRFTSRDPNERRKRSLSPGEERSVAKKRPRISI